MADNNEIARQARLARFCGGSNAADDNEIARKAKATTSDGSIINVNATASEQPFNVAAAPKQGASISVNGIFDGIYFAEKKQKEKEQEDKKTTKRQRDMVEAAKPAQRFKVSGMHRHVGSIDQAKAAKHKELGGMDKFTKQNHLQGGLYDTRKAKKSVYKKKTGVHGFRKK